MTDTKTGQVLARSFAVLSRAAARKKLYSRKATKLGRPEVARFLRAVSASEAVQAHRLFSSLIGKVDTTDRYLKTVFEKEMQDILAKYKDLIDSADSERPALVHALSQLRAAEKRLLSFYSSENEDVSVSIEAEYFVCSFCGYLSTECPPEKCPICGASQDAFHKVD